MRKVIFLLTVLMFTSCIKENQESFGKTEPTNEVQKPEVLGKEIFEGKGNCMACHQMDQKVIGPSVQDIAKIYKDKNGDIILFLKGEREPIVDASQYEIMKTNFAITKTFSDEELEALEAYVYSNLK